MSVYASFIGGVIGIVLLALLSVPVAQAALAFGPTEMTALMCFALSLVTVLGGRNIIKGFTALFLGMWIGMIGLDPIAGPTRYTFGFLDLFEGIDFTIIAVGLYGLSEMFVSLSPADDRQARELQLQVAASEPARPGHVQMGARLELADRFFRRGCAGRRGNRLHHARLRDREEVFAEPGASSARDQSAAWPRPRRRTTAPPMLR